METPIMKCLKVINSCTTVQQLFVAQQYKLLYFKAFKLSYEDKELITKLWYSKLRDMRGPY
jgi:hypothetical protein